MAGAEKPPLSELAKKYGHPTGSEFKIVANSGKSGLTPVHVPLHLKSSLSKKQKNYIIELDWYQQTKCHNFTTQQLVNLEAFAPYYNSWSIEGREEGGLDFERVNTIPIHPLYAKSKWDRTNFGHIGRIPLGKGRPGYFEGQNPLVWQALEPCIRLASGILSNSSNLVWWEALFNGEYEFIEDNIPDMWKGGKLLRFQPSYGPLRDEQQLQRDILDISDKIGLSLHSGLTYEGSGCPLEAGEFTFGVTVRDRAGEIRIYIALEILECLMRDELTPAERKLEIFRVAVTLLHETAHAVWLNIEHQHSVGLDHEPYFEGQPISELGFSMEETVFGGTAFSISDSIGPFMDFGPEIPCGTIFNVPNSYRSKRDHNKAESIFVPPFPPNWKYIDSFPIPIGYFEDVLLPEFLDHARQFGIETTKMGPKTIGSRIKFNSRRGQYTWSPDVDPPANGYITLCNRMSYEEESAATLENLRRSRAQRILTAIGGRQDSIDQDDFDTDPMDIDDPNSVLEETDPNHYTVQGKDFDTLSAISSECDPDELPECPRYEEIRDYLRANRAQGRLCLDTMCFDIPLYTLFQYIQVFGGINITPEEWLAFIQNCDNRSEMFFYYPIGQGMIKYLKPLSVSQTPLPSVPTSPVLPAPPALQWLRDACLKGHKLELGLPDFDFFFLLKVLRYQDPRGGGWLNEIVLRELVDWHDKYGDLWFWGPNWIVRRRLDTWPSQMPLSASSSSNNSSSQTSNSNSS